MSTETRSFAGDLEIRGDGRTLYGLLAPYDVETRISTFTEVFRRGVFADATADPALVKLLVAHNRQALPIGRATSLTEDAAGLVGEFHVSATQAGDEALTLIRDGAVNGLSVGFAPRPNGDRWNRQRTHVERVSATLVETSVVAWPAYEGAKVLAVREEFTYDRMPRLALARWR